MMGTSSTGHRMRPFRLVALAACMLLTHPLEALPAADPIDRTVLPDIALPPELDRVLRDYEQAWAAADAAALASLFAEDGFVLQNNGPPVRGRPAIQALYASQGGARLQLRAVAFSSGSTEGFIIGAYRYAGQAGDIGKFTLTLRRAPDGPWLIFSDMDNLNAAAPPQRVPQS